MPSIIHRNCRSPLAAILTVVLIIAPLLTQFAPAAHAFLPRGGRPIGLVPRTVSFRGPVRRLGNEALLHAQSEGAGARLRSRRSAAVEARRPARSREPVARRRREESIPIPVLRRRPRDGARVRRIDRPRGSISGKFALSHSEPHAKHDRARRKRAPIGGALSLDKLTFGSEQG